MKPLKLLLPLGIIVLILVAVFVYKPGAPGVTGDRVVSEDGSAELVSFFDALAAKNYAQAAEYVQANCSSKPCFAENKSADDIASDLKTLCEDHFCTRVEIDGLGTATTSGLFPHTVAFLDSEGNRQPVCIDTECQIKKNTTQFRMKNVDGLFYLVDVPPIKLN
ncbi:hypothetical protein COV06_01030 [Candidatus Uhrbacteria bacterium CG10_big_fil_rev_8_21_14_0_10_50_16]|uniref:Uncharacterized protein n=1 Tax=Candidatus Uhrbacteria bacterium CG10_big_fil_rev_8_21_14_0_10_50_16 TaxID=1975039 RepID=A0A2H0RNE4_9BACT|nr:MAG: hypothetical protein COV06_01030 [Candidatus Uhrbacteria bacterium CG10_big_fil_rev_8_21_14_0_10_50_16]